jgi:hypothetical protein
MSNAHLQKQTDIAQAPTCAASKRWPAATQAASASARASDHMHLRARLAVIYGKGDLRDS